MAKRKAARAAGRTAGKQTAAKKAVKKTAGKAARKTAAKKVVARSANKAAKKSAKTSARAAGKKSTKAAKKAARPAARKATRAVATPTAKAAARKAPARSAARPAAKAAPKRTARTVPKKRSSDTVPFRKAPNLDRARRTITDDDELMAPTGSVPSSLDLDRSASSARSGRRELRERFEEHTETSPALTGGDIDADWESAYSVGDEAPGGDNPTPDQDIVDDIGRAVGNEYQDNEELKGADKIAKRDQHRWELDPASAEDYDDRE